MQSESAAAAAEALAAELARTAVERDRRGGHAAHERALIRESGLLDLALPRRLGGRELPWTELLAVVRSLARADSALAHVFAFHHLQVATVLLYGEPAQHERLLRPVAAGRFWGNALNPLDPRLVATESPAGLVLEGSKRFCSGAKGADWLLVSALLEGTDQRVCAAVRADDSGIRIHDDWDAFGQRQTDSGSVDFRGVVVPWGDLLRQPGPLGSVRATLRPCISQLILVNLYAGIAAGALGEARDYVRESQDLYVLRRFGEMQASLRAAEALADLAARELQAAWERGDALGVEERGRCALTIAEAKVFAARAGLEITAQIFDAAGAGATSARLGLDRFWRNLRTHSLHDPLDYKLREIGEWALNARLPVPSSYS